MNSTLSVVFLIYTALVLALSFGTSLVSFLVGAACFIIFVLIIWESCIKQRGNLSILVPWLHGEPRSNYLPVLYFLIVFSFSVLYWLAYFPGGFNLDAYGQWEQAHGTLLYSDWHPIMSTLIIKLVCSIFDSFSFYITVQLLLFSLSIAILLKALQDIGVNSCILLVLATYIGISPAIGLNSICLTKDVQFAILLINLTTCYIKIIFSNGLWIERRMHIILLGILSGLTILVRHNGILFVAPAFIILIVIYRPKVLRIGCALMISAIAVFLIKVPVMQVLDVEPHENVVGEAVGIPMGILGNALVNDPENVPEDVYTFLTEIASLSDWESHYIVGKWDSCKWEFGGTELLQNQSILGILHYTTETIICCPQATYESVRLNTQIVWEPLYTDPNWIPEEYIAENDIGISSSPVLMLHDLFEQVKAVSLVPVLNCLIWNTGFQIVLLMIFFCLNHSIINTGKILLFVPLLIYDFGTMLLLAGPNQRYFYCNAVLFLPIVIALLIGKSDKGTNA